MYIKNQKDFWAGLMFVGFGVFFAGVGSQYPFGSTARMGAGYFPTVVGVILIFLGIVIAAGGVANKIAANKSTVQQPEKVDKVDKFAWSTLVLILGSIVLFGLFLETIGLVLALLMLILMSSYASHEFHWKTALGNACVLIVLCLAVFVFALDLQFTIWPAVLAG